MSDDDDGVAFIGDADEGEEPGTPAEAGEVSPEVTQILAELEELLPAGIPGPAFSVTGMVARIQLDRPEDLQARITPSFYSFEVELLSDALAAHGDTLLRLLASQALHGEVRVLASPRGGEMVIDESALPDLASPAVECTRAEQLLVATDAKLELDTAGARLGAVDRIYTAAAQLRDEPDRLLDEALVHGLVEQARALSQMWEGWSTSGLVGPVEQIRTLHSFWCDLSGGLYRLWDRENQATPLLVYNRALARLDTAGNEAHMLSMDHPDLIARLHRDGFLVYDARLIATRMRELEDEMLVVQGVNPLKMESETRSQLVGERRRQLPRVWHELGTVSRSMQGGMRLETLLPARSAEIRIKLSRPAKHEYVLARMLADLDTIDYGRLFLNNRRAFARELAKAAPLKREYMVDFVRRALTAPAVVQDGPAEDIVFLS